MGEKTHKKLIKNLMTNHFKKSDEDVFNDKCPICLENKKRSFIVLQCNHKIHKKCCKRLISFECPLCRTISTTYPKSIKNKIQKNISKNKEQRQLEEERESEELASQIMLINIPETVVEEFFNEEELNNLFNNESSSSSNFLRFLAVLSELNSLMNE